MLAICISFGMSVSQWVVPSSYGCPDPKSGASGWQGLKGMSVMWNLGILLKTQELKYHILVSIKLEQAAPFALH